MRTLIRLIIFGVIILVIAIWYYGDKNPHAAKAKEELQSAATEAKEFVQDKIGTNNLSAEEIKDELVRTGKIVRLKAESMASAVDAAQDTKITATVKAKLLSDQVLSVLNISVSTTNGVVSLSGTSSSPENIRKAIQLAMDTSGVHKVESTLQVK